MISADRMAAVDANAAALGIARGRLMESGGGAVARAVREATDPGDAVAVVCGRGNNGGDGAVAARALGDRDVTVHLLGRADAITTGIARESWDALVASEADAREVQDSAALALGEPDLVVDAMLGTGARGPPREPEASAVATVAATGAPVLSVDVPTGVDADTGERPGVAVDADRVVTFHDAKPGLAGLEATVTVADIGIPAAAEWLVGPGDLRGLDRRASAHKGDHGEVLVVGGGPYTGAPALAARAAARAGADLVRVACPRAIAREVQATEPGLIVRPFDGERLSAAAVPAIRERASAHDALVVGPGLGDADATREAVRDLLVGHDGRAVVDADALRVVAGIETDATLVCTPHAGELRAMGHEAGEDRADRERAVLAAAADLGATVLLKGHHDVASDGERVRVARTGTPAMTVGGTGDVLAGVVGALLARREPDLVPLRAAGVGAYVNGVAGELAAAGRESGLVATDLLDRLPAALGGEAGARI